MSTEEMKRALELAREGVEIHSPNMPEYKVCAALLAFAEQDEKQEPVAEVAGRFGNMHIKFLPAGMFLQPGDPLYPAPQQRKLLTHDEYFEIGMRHWMPSNKIEQIHKDIEAKLKEKNNG